MDRFFRKGCKKTPLHHPISPNNPTISPADPSDVRAAQNVGSKTKEHARITDSHIMHQGGVPESSTSVPVFGGIGYGNGPIDEQICDEKTAEKFGSLKAILEAVPVVYANESGAVAVGNKVEDLLSRIVALEELFDSRPDDVTELRHRGKLQSKLKGIIEQLKPLVETSEQCIHEISGALEGLRETIFDYQMARQKSIHTRRLKEINPAGAAILNNFRSAQGAEFRHGDRKGCLKGTRVAVLDEIALWARDFDKSPVYWLNGLAGTGKTTIAQTVAERLFAEGKLGASFFCSRDFEDRSNLYFIIPTLAVQLARNCTEFRSVFVPLAQSDPGIAHESLYNQMNKLITEPLQESGTSTVIVIDALDECKDEETASAILSVLGRLVSEMSGVKFFLTGRPEPRIQTGFRLPLLKSITEVFVLHDAEPNRVTNDVRLFLKYSFLEMAYRRGGLNGWPTDEEVENLCDRTAGLFVYAVATVKFIDKRGTNCRNQLDLLLQSPDSGVREAKTKFKPNTTLDSLYTSILQEAFGDEDDPDNDPKVRSVLGAVLLATNPLSPSAIATLLDLDVDDVFPLLSSAQSLLILQEDIDCPVRPFHKSFPDFIVDPNRCTNRRFLLFPPHHHSQLLIRCLDLMDRSLEKNMCKLPDGVANSDVDDLKERTERHIAPALRYACRSWHTHLTGGHATSVNTLEITTTLHRFLERNFLFWLEVLSVLGAVRNAVDALQAAQDWLEESPTLDLANDCSRFVTQHFEIISASSPHIYHSALVLTPRRSIVQKLYNLHAQPFVRVVQGVPELWDVNTATVTFRFGIGLAIWSPCNRFIAVSPECTMPVVILDSTTLQRLQSLELSPEISAFSETFAFSPDSRMLTSIIRRNYYPDTDAFVVSWDLQTGGVVSVIEWKGSRDTEAGNAHITYSRDGKKVAILSRHQSPTTISICDVASGVYTHDIHHSTRIDPDLTLGIPYVYKIWTHGESLQFATPGPTAITIWEVGFASGATPTEVETVSIPDNAAETFVFKPGGQSDIAWTEFHPASCRLAFIRNGTEGTLLVWDARASKFLLQHSTVDSRTSMSFSSDGDLFACVTTESEVCLWRESLTGYTPLGKFTPGTRYPNPLLSLDGKSIITVSGLMIQLWHTTSFTTATSQVLVQALQHTGERFVLEFLPDRPLAVIARRGDKVVMVFDLEHGVLLLTIEASLEIYGLRSIGNTVVVVGHDRAIAWDLPGGNSLSNGRVGVNDSTWTINLGNIDLNNSFIEAASISSDFQYIALARYGAGQGFLDVYCTSTRQNLCAMVLASVLWFTPGGHNIWCANDGEAEVFSITQNTLDHSKTIADIEERSWGCPWGSLCGYKVTEDGWIVSASGKRLLMLPPHWQSRFKVDRVWNEKFLSLLYGMLSEPVILELEP